MQKITNQFLALQIPKAIWGEYFKGKKMCRILNLVFLECINSTMICLRCAIIYHTPQAWQTGIYKEPVNFKPEAVEGQSKPYLISCLRTLP